MEAKPRFNLLDCDEIDEILNGRHSERTKQVIKGAKATFLEYLDARNITLDDVVPSTADKILQGYFLGLRKQDGSLYKSSGFDAIRYGLQEFLRKEKLLNISDHEAFPLTEEAVKAARKMIKQDGKGNIEHKKRLSGPDLEKLHGFLHQGQVKSPKRLQQKVFVDLMLHFCRRGRENLRELEKHWFEFASDENGDKYVSIRDEFNKNHREGNNARSTQARMYKSKTGACPLTTLRVYMSKLDPRSNVFFQMPKDYINSQEEAWYYPRPLGKNTLGNMMRTLSEQAGLAAQYTNHCLRATSISLLDEAGYEGRAIQKISGHKSMESLSHYSNQVSTHVLKNMSSILEGNISGATSEVAQSEPSKPGSVDRCGVGHNFSGCSVVIHYH